MAATNAFQMLDEDVNIEGTSSNDNEHGELSVDRVNDDQTSETTTSQVDTQTWTDVLSTKSRRLAPQCTISMQDADSRKNRAPQPEKDTPKKKGYHII